ncbi:hypothetical protein BD779DRAFT_1471272 [Infundibulicybe gibba]|nr:hypothetical protein BD779DRAFT_1471272 [Infundibulicybe gibba]
MNSSSGHHFTHTRISDGTPKWLRPIWARIAPPVLDEAGARIVVGDLEPEIGQQGKITDNTREFAPNRSVPSNNTAARNAKRAEVRGLRPQLKTSLMLVILPGSSYISSEPAASQGKPQRLGNRWGGRTKIGWENCEDLLGSFSGYAETLEIKNYGGPGIDSDLPEEACAVC